MDFAIDITPGTLAQVKQTLRGHTIQVDDDVQGVANDLAALGAFSLHYDGEQDLWVVMQLHDGEEKLVTTAQECDPRIVKRVQQVVSDGYNLAAEIDRAEREDEAQREHQLREVLGDYSDRLTHALSKDLEHDLRM